MRVESHGISTELPPGWEAEITVRPESEEEAALATGEKTTMPVAHLANFPLPPERGDFGSNAVEIMTADDVLVCLIEFDRGSAGTALYAREGIPVLTPDAFSPESMQRALPGQSGAQEFFSVGGRAFCVYVVLGSHTRRAETVEIVNQLLATTQITPAD